MMFIEAEGNRISIGGFRFLCGQQSVLGRKNILFTFYLSPQLYKRSTVGFKTECRCRSNTEYPNRDVKNNNKSSAPRSSCTSSIPCPPNTTQMCDVTRQLWMILTVSIISSSHTATKISCWCRRSFWNG